MDRVIRSLSGMMAVTRSNTVRASGSPTKAAENSGSSGNKVPWSMGVSIMAQDVLGFGPRFSYRRSTAGGKGHLRLKAQNSYAFAQLRLTLSLIITKELERFHAERNR
ncbi:exported protein of unknown function [Magnetospirillum gryphiswaldense MSR-1 v2]|uniref:Uncharacterized protein n=1 Tax=Magnetospirillum gryphiswaldense (strain DSM 6361 / JCM 21280 / NBRC 15271 / MSR-1) TaxID=431944 RepID=V6F0D9_MAGGM|nr:exported protein of unknown function [Magnetospirillum gryphiswaldense MSR-1 v2]